MILFGHNLKETKLRVHEKTIFSCSQVSGSVRTLCISFQSNIPVQPQQHRVHGIRAKEITHKMGERVLDGNRKICVNLRCWFTSDHMFHREEQIHLIISINGKFYFIVFPRESFPNYIENNEF